MPEEFRRQIVTFRTAEKPGTVIIDGDRHFLYLVLPDFQAVRYGIGVGRDGFGWVGIVRVGRKVEWPTCSCSVPARPRPASGHRPTPSCPPVHDLAQRPRLMPST